MLFHLLHEVSFHSVTHIYRNAYSINSMTTINIMHHCKLLFSINLIYTKKIWTICFGSTEIIIILYIENILEEQLQSSIEHYYITFKKEIILSNITHISKVCARYLCIVLETLVCFFFSVHYCIF